MADNLLAQQNANTMALIAYICMLTGLLFPVTMVAAVVIAYVYRGTDTVLDTHFGNVIGVFWWGLGIGIFGLLTSFIIVGWVVLFGLYVWILIRMIRGLSALKRGVPYGAPPVLAPVPPDGEGEA
ncbi:MAG: hypothetical protein RLZZ501_1408 [Pseudomonadota bacterium]